MNESSSAKEKLKKKKIDEEKLNRDVSIQTRVFVLQKLISTKMSIVHQKGIAAAMMAYAREVVVAIAAEQGFDAEEALSSVGLPEPSCAPRKQKTKGVLLPWCGVVDESSCQGVRVNHGLYTQCKNEKANGGSYCKTCGSGDPKYGDISERSAEDFACASKVVRYSSVMAKLGISRGEAEAAASAAGVEIAEAEFEEVSKGQRGRPRKLTDTSSSSDSDSGEPKKRGRPRKQKGVVARSSGDDLIASLMAIAAETSNSSDDSSADDFDAAVNEAEKAAKAISDAEKLAEKQAKLDAKAAEKQAKLDAKAAEKQAKLLAKEAEKQAKLLVKSISDAEKLAEKQAKLEAKSISDAEKLAEKEAKLEAKEAEKQAKLDAKVISDAEKQAKLLAKVISDAEKLAEKEAKLLAKAAKEAEKQAKLEAKAISDAEKLAEKEAKLEAKAISDAEKLAEKEAKLDAKAISDAEKEEAQVTEKLVSNGISEEQDQASDEEESEEEEEEDGTEVEEFTWEDVDYILDASTGTLYDKSVFTDSGEAVEVGQYDKASNTVTLV